MVGDKISGTSIGNISTLLGGAEAIHTASYHKFHHVPILFGLGNYKKLIRKGKQLILHEVIPRWACNRREEAGAISSHS
uniref:Uncharacterized protein n=1 Tax=Oryza glumipatula TaxID=40148 RepID=A0A0E0A858_9ORYZ